MNPKRAIAYRKQAAALLESVINDQLEARTAINCWPTLGNQDPSVRCVYTMLWYFESDEDRHHVETYYSDLQLKFLQEAIAFLKEGEPLPLAVLQMYLPSTAPPEYMSSWTWRTPLWKLTELGEMILGILETNPWLNRNTKPKGPRYAEQSFWQNRIIAKR